MDLTIPGLPAASTLTGTEKIPAAQGANDVSFDLNKFIADLITPLLNAKYNASNPNNYIDINAITDDLVTSKLLTGLSITGSTVLSTDSVKTAIGSLQNQVNALLGGVNYQGSWNANTNSPTMPSASGRKGHYYVVTTAGTTNISGISDWKLGDWIISNGTDWQKVDNTDAVVSVNGYSGIVTLAVADIVGLVSALADKVSMAGIETLTNKRILPGVNESTGTSLTPEFELVNIEILTGINGALTISHPEGTYQKRENRVIELKDDGTARAITWHGIYASKYDTLPTTTIAGKSIRVYLEYNDGTTKWECLSVMVEL